MKNQNNFNEFQALNQAELENIFGGESAWYWIAYGVGRLAAMSGGGSGAYHDAMSSSNYGGIR